MATSPMGIAALCIAFFIVWRLVIVGDAIVEIPDKERDNSDGWHGPDESPPDRGRYASRMPGKPATESLSTYWNGKSWRYLDGSECYVQRREWKPLPDAMVEGMVQGVDG